MRKSTGSVAERILRLAEQLQRLAQEIVDNRMKLFAELAEARRHIADKHGVRPAYVATNETLYNMLAVAPTTMAALKRVPGIGNARADKYGEDLLEALHEVLRKAEA